MFSKKLKALRKAKGLKQKQLGDIIGVEQSQISGYEIGRVKPSYEVLIKLSDFFHVPLDYFYENENHPGKRLMRDIDLSDEEFLKKIKLFYQGDPLTEEEIKKLLSYLRFLKSDNK